MSGSDNNQFSQVATLLISLTIIVSGVVYNGTITKTEAQFGIVVDQIPLLSSLAGDFEDNLNIEENTSEQNQTNEVSLTETTTITPVEAAEKIDIALAPIEQFLSFLEDIDFANSEPKLNLPGSETNSTPVPKPEETIEKNIVSDVEMPTLNDTTQNTALKQIESIADYLRWEELKQSYRQNFGSKECMLQTDVCLSNW